MSLRKRSQSRRGSSVLEAALVFPILLSLSFGCVEFGHYFFIKHTLQAAAREGARAAVTSASADANTLVDAAIKTTMNNAGIIDANYSRTVQNTSNANIVAGTQTAGTAIVIRVQCTWGTVGVRPLGVIGSGKLVIGTTTMRKEG